MERLDSERLCRRLFTGRNWLADLALRDRGTTPAAAAARERASIRSTMDDGVKSYVTGYAIAKRLMRLRVSIDKRQEGGREKKRDDKNPGMRREML